MELPDMHRAVLMIVLIGIVIGVGIIILDQFGTTMKDSTVVLNESVTFTAGSGTTTNDDVTSIEFVQNFSTYVILNNETTSNDVNFTSGGVISIGVEQPNTGVLNISYTYDADSITTTAVFSARDATDDFVTWLPVIIIIIASAIIITLVMRSFRQ